MRTWSEIALRPTAILKHFGILARIKTSPVLGLWTVDLGVAGVWYLQNSQTSIPNFFSILCIISGWNMCGFLLPFLITLHPTYSYIGPSSFVLNNFLVSCIIFWRLLYLQPLTCCQRKCKESLLHCQSLWSVGIHQLHIWQTPILSLSHKLVSCRINLRLVLIRTCPWVESDNHLNCNCLQWPPLVW